MLKEIEESLKEKSIYDAIQEFKDNIFKHILTEEVFKENKEKIYADLASIMNNWGSSCHNSLDSGDSNVWCSAGSNGSCSTCLFKHRTSMEVIKSLTLFKEQRKGKHVISRMFKTTTSRMLKETSSNLLKDVENGAYPVSDEEFNLIKETAVSSYNTSDYSESLKRRLTYNGKIASVVYYVFYLANLGYFDTERFAVEYIDNEVYGLLYNALLDYTFRDKEELK